MRALLYGIGIAVSASAFIYLSYFYSALPLLDTVLGLVTLLGLLIASARVWFWSGFFIGIFWFWWIALSFIHYRMPWAVPLVILGIALIYGGIFWLIAKTALRIECFVVGDKISPSPLPSLILKALGLLGLSYLHPFGFDWFKPELMFVRSILGVEKWQFALILTSLVLTIYRRNPLYSLLLFGAYAPMPAVNTLPPQHIAIVTTHTPVEQKWNSLAHPEQFEALFGHIDRAIEEGKKLIILPESVFPVFLNRDPELFERIKARAKRINIVTGGLYLDGHTPRNSTYIFTTDGNVTIANKVALVPFGEANPLPKFLGDWVNRLFYDGAVDYRASDHVADYTIEGQSYRNAICFEATSERLYQNHPEHMIVLSNNGWFTPSIEPTLQKLLLLYYHRKYGTNFYHAVNMSPSYAIQGVRP